MARRTAGARLAERDTTVMAPEVLRRLVLRANPAVEFIPAAELAAYGFRRHGAGTRRVMYAGIMRARRQPWWGNRAVEPAVVAAWQALHRPGPMPARLLPRFGAMAARDIARLVLDGVLQVHDGEGFRCGAAALTTLALAPPAVRPVDLSPTARLSMAALEHAEALAIADAERLGARLYFFHRFPATPAWRRRIGDHEALERFLQIEAGSPMRRALERHWRRAERDHSNDGWLQWWPRRVHAQAARVALPCKVFVSPDPRAAPDALRITVEVLEGLGAPPFKIGRGLHGLLRPDKFVVYFARYQDMIEAAHALATALDAVPPHGVPFSAAVGDRGVVSWGVDPWNSQHPLPWRHTDSWRTDLTARLARYLLVARHTAPPDLAPRAYALARVGLDGIDPLTWAPAAGRFGAEAG